MGSKEAVERWRCSCTVARVRRVRVKIFILLADQIFELKTFVALLSFRIALRIRIAEKTSRVRIRRRDKDSL